MVCPPTPPLSGVSSAPLFRDQLVVLLRRDHPAAREGELTPRACAALAHVQDGDKVVVRSVATGSPRGDFMGLHLGGSRSFRMMAVDIHTVERGRIRRVHHVEEWLTAIKQLSARGAERMPRHTLSR